jgi:hypothetical protein
MATTTVRQHESRKKDQATRVRKKKAQTMEIKLRGPTGPRTRRGKQRPRYNAVKHGIFSEVVLRGREPIEQYESLLCDLTRQFRPEGTLEEVLVEKLAMLLWRHRRLVQTESAEIAKVTEFVEEDTRNLRYFDAEDRENRAGKEDALLHRCTNEFVYLRAISLLKDLRGGIKARGVNRVEDCEFLRRIYGGGAMGPAEGLYLTYSNFAERVEKVREVKADIPGLSTENVSKGALQFIDLEIEHLEQLKKIVEQNERLRVRYTVTASLVPHQAVLDRLLRYEASLDRSFDRTLNQLERLQRMRLGHAVPPPVKVELSP